MPRKNSQIKPVHSFRLSYESLRQISELSINMGRSEDNVVEIALDRMYREEIRFWNLSVREGQKPQNNYKVEIKKDQFETSDCCPGSNASVYHLLHAHNQSTLRRTALRQTQRVFGIKKKRSTTWFKSCRASTLPSPRMRSYFRSN
jgi:hypothetical protein